jgi:hypothetical protein
MSANDLSTACKVSGPADHGSHFHCTVCNCYGWCKGNLTNLRRELHLSLAKGNPK